MKKKDLFPCGALMLQIIYELELRINRDRKNIAEILA